MTRPAFVKGEFSTTVFSRLPLEVRQDLVRVKEALDRPPQERNTAHDGWRLSLVVGDDTRGKLTALKKFLGGARRNAVNRSAVKRALDLVNLVNTTGRGNGG